MSIPKTAEFVIVGGGVMGASIAYHLAARGMRDILLLEKNEFFGQEATGRCAGGVRYQFATEVNIRLSLVSLPMLERFEQEIGQAIDFRKCGYIFLLTNPEDVAIFQRNRELQNRLGAETQWLDGAEIRRRLPLMRLEDVLGGTFNPEDGVVDPNSVVMGYINAAHRLGVTALTGIEVTGIQVQADRIAAVETSNGSVSTRQVIDAAGPWAGLIGKMANVAIPITPIRRQWFTTNALPEIPADFPFVIDFAQSLYFHREGQGLLIGMSNPGELPGFDQNIDPAWELVNVEAAAERLPLLEKASLAIPPGGVVRSHSGCPSNLRQDLAGGVFRVHRILRSRLYARTRLGSIDERDLAGWQSTDGRCVHARPGALPGGAAYPGV